MSGSTGRLDLVLAGALAVLAALVYANALHGDFVYDDTKQIVDNHLIQEPGRMGEALTSDVWAFKGDRDESWSNYWRPTFMLWLGGSYRLFGLEETSGWHLSNVLLHALVTVLAFALVRRIGFDRGLAAATSAVYAVHPTHVESVAWISGSPNMLLAAPLLGALILVLPRAGRISAWRWAGALALYCVALGAKEISILFAALVVVTVVVVRSELPRSARVRAALLTAVPFAALAAGYFVLRWAVLGRVEIETPWRLGALDLLLNVPPLFALYLRQSLFPLWLGPSYPLRAVTAGTLEVGNFWLPLGICLVTAGLVVWIVSRRPVTLVGVALFLLPLAPAFNINAFIPEQLVHDRYLYLPLLGFWMVALAGLAAALERVGGGRARATSWTVAVAALLVVPFALQTWRYNRAWTSEVALWELGVRVDPSSAFNLAQYGYALHREGRVDEALEALDRALAIGPVTTALLTRGEIRREQGRFAEARLDLELVVSAQPTNSLAYEQLAATLLAEGRADQAADLLATGRSNVPHRRCAFTSNRGVALYVAGRRAEALAELEAARELVATESNSACRKALYHLASLYRESGRAADAARELHTFLAVTTGSSDDEILRLRRVAGELLQEP